MDLVTDTCHLPCASTGEACGEGEVCLPVTGYPQFQMADGGYVESCVPDGGACDTPAGMACQEYASELWLCMKTMRACGVAVEPFNFVTPDGGVAALTPESMCNPGPNTGFMGGNVSGSRFCDDFADDGLSRPPQVQCLVMDSSAGYCVAYCSYGSASADGDGGVTKDELRAAREKLGPRPGATALFRHFDADGDGKLVAGEVPALARERLLRADADGDAAVTPEEIRQAICARLA